MTDSRLDAKMEHLLIHFVLVKVNNHEIRKMFPEYDLYDFKEFTSCDKQSFVEMERPKNNGNGIARFNDRKINLINNVSLTITSFEVTILQKHWQMIPKIGWKMIS